MNMIRKGQLQGVAKGDVMGQVEYARSNFWRSGITSGEAVRSFCPQIVFATQPKLLLQLQDII